MRRVQSAYAPVIGRPDSELGRMDQHALLCCLHCVITRLNTKGFVLAVSERVNLQDYSPVYGCINKLLKEFLRNLKDPSPFPVADFLICVLPGSTAGV